MPLRIAFFGTPDAAVPSLQALIESPHRIAGVLTAPDRPKGRGMQVEASPVKKAAEKAGLEIYQPPTLKNEEAHQLVAGLGAEVIVVVAYGFILPAEVLKTPRLGCLNVHFSLLPLLRGAAPVQWALIHGLKTTGITIMQMDEGLDTGPVLSSVEEPIGPDDTAGTMQDKLARSGAALLLEVLDKLSRGEITPQPQDDSKATLAPKITPADARIDWAGHAVSIVNRIRGLNPRPGAWTVLGSRRLKIYRAEALPGVAGGPPGTLAVAADGRLSVAAGSGSVLMLEVQPEGRSRMPAAEFVRGYRPDTGDRFEQG